MIMLQIFYWRIERKNQLFLQLKLMIERKAISHVSYWSVRGQIPRNCVKVKKTLVVT